jgi:hypothetical protein
MILFFFVLTLFYVKKFFFCFVGTNTIWENILFLYAFETFIIFLYDGFFWSTFRFFGQLSDSD